MKKRLFSLLLVLAVFACIAIPAGAQTDFGSCVVDQADLLTDAEERTLETRLENLADNYSVDVVIVTVETSYGDDNEEYAEWLYLTYGYGIGNDRDGILLLIDMDPSNRGWAIYCHGLGADAMPHNQIMKLGDAMTPDLKAGDFAAAFDLFVRRCEERLNIAINGEPFAPGMSLLISLIIGFVIALIVTGIMRSKLKSVRSQRAAANYVRQGSMHLTESYDLFLYRTVTRRARPKSSSSGSSVSSRSRSSSGSGRF